MDTSPPKLNTYTRVVPLRGSKLQKLKDALKQDMRNGKQQKRAENFSEFSIQCPAFVGHQHIKTEDSVKVDAVIKIEPLQEEKEQSKAPDSKIIIQKVEKVTFDVSSLLFSPGGSRNSHTEAGCSSAHIEQNDATPEKSVAIALDFTEKPAEAVTVSLPPTQLPESAPDNKVPTKQVRAVKQLKPKPNLPKRVHRIQTFRPSHVPPAKLPLPELAIEPVVPAPIVIKKEEPAVKKTIIKSVKSDTESSDCCGFEVDSDEPTVIKYYDFLKSEISVPEVASKPLVKLEEKAKTAVKIESQPKIVLPAKRATRQSSLVQEKKIAEIPKQQLVSKAKSPEKIPETVPKPVAVAKKPVKPESNSWQNDILAVIGTSRLKEIDEMLKNIPNIIDGNFNPIEMENVELKLIIKHLLRKLKVESITDTLSPGDSQPNFSSEGS